MSGIDRAIRVLKNGVWAPVNNFFVNQLGHWTPVTAVYYNSFILARAELTVLLLVITLLQYRLV